jgi:glycogen operon protein
MLLPGNAIEETDDRGRPVIGSTLFVMFNAGATAVAFELPPSPTGVSWTLLLDTADPQAPLSRISGLKFTLEGRSVVVLRLTTARERASRRRVRAADGGEAHG